MTEDLEILCKSYFGESLTASENEVLSDFGANFTSRRLPIIFDNAHLSSLIGIKLGSLQKMVRDTSLYYYHFKIPKRDGSNREIAAPSAALYFVQRWIYDNILAQEEVGDFSFGFARGRSIVDNARCHLGAACLLQMDLENFFPSISFERICSVFRYMGYTNDVCYTLASVCALSGCLPQGAPTSPMLSNIVAKRLDRRISSAMKSLGLNYSRYADDLCVSGLVISRKVQIYLEEIIESEGFKVNANKTRSVKGKGRKIVTGISISSGKLTIPRSAKREIRKNVHHILRVGLLKHLEVTGGSDIIFIERLIGKLNFWRMVEPDNEYVVSSIEKLVYESKMLDKHAFMR